MRSSTVAIACATLVALAACSEPVATPADPEVDAQGAGITVADELAATGPGSRALPSAGTVHPPQYSAFGSRRAVPHHLGGGSTPISASRSIARGWKRDTSTAVAAPSCLRERWRGHPSWCWSKQFYPLDHAAIDAEFTAQRTEYDGRPHKQAAFDAGDAIGREVAAAVLVEAASDSFGVAPLPTQPVGPGYWVSSGAAVNKGDYGARLFFLHSPDEINAPSPPAFGLRRIPGSTCRGEGTLGRTHAGAGGDHHQVGAVLRSALQRVLAADLMDRHYRGELEAARIFAYGNVAAFEAITGCFHTKYTYWFIRPTRSRSQRHACHRPAEPPVLSVSALLPVRRVAGDPARRVPVGTASDQRHGERGEFLACRGRSALHVRR